VTEHDFEAFAGFMAVLEEVFGKDLTPQLVEIYFRALANFSIERVAAAIEEAVRRLKFFPKPADLIELMEGSLDDQAEHAFGQFWGAVIRCGTYRSLYSEDEVLAEVIRRQFGSWANAGNSHAPTLIRLRIKSIIKTSWPRTGTWPASGSDGTPTSSAKLRPRTSPRSPRGRTASPRSRLSRTSRSMATPSRARSAP